MELTSLIPDHVGPEITIRPQAVSFVTDAFGQIQDNCDGENMVLPRQRHERLARFGLKLSGSFGQREAVQHVARGQGHVLTPVDRITDGRGRVVAAGDTNGNCTRADGRGGLKAQLMGCRQTSEVLLAVHLTHRRRPIQDEAA